VAKPDTKPPARRRPPDRSAEKEQRRREQQLRAARRFLDLPHLADHDEVTAALHYIEFRNRAFLATKKRHTKPAKLAAGSLVQAMLRAQKAGLPVPPEWFHFYQHIATAGRASANWQLVTAWERPSNKNNPGMNMKHSDVQNSVVSHTPGKPKRAEGFKPRLALQQAFWLLNDRNRPCTASLKSDWCTLAAILLGIPQVTPGLVSQARQLRAAFKL
jgi:hypothetical protein